MQQIMITNKLHTGTAFAVLADDMTQNVFIPSKLALDANLRPGQKVQAIVVPNMTRPDRTPWLAVSILDAAPPPQDDALAEMILHELQYGRATVEDIAVDLNMSDEKIAAKMAELVASGQLVREVCYSLPEEDA